ncbi:immunoglobulin-like domain-containing protein [Hyalangium versicolor]|uniref:immunoglobulin-like domain-containing protein n=1 Tax=Hyalangium versicolor TaxID=2861190 RepID=UPI001CCB04CD|nr:immunoglobulin-like domain-containing protein [Hyalangium versicolor]
MKLKGVWGAALVVVALAASSCDQKEGAPPPDVAPASTRTTRQDVRSTNKVLILSSTVDGGANSKEAAAVQAANSATQIEVVTPAQWNTMTATQFMSYKAIIIGDAACESGSAAFQAAINNRKTWGPIIDGDVAIIASNPSSNGVDQLVYNGVKFALNSVQYLTGMYVSLGCAYQDAAAPTHVELLEPFGEFQVQGLSTCADTEHMFEMYNSIMSTDTWDWALVGNDACATRTVFTKYPDHTFSYAAIAVNSSGDPLPGERHYIDYSIDPGNETPYTGTPYVIVRGAMPLGGGCGTPNAPLTSQDPLLVSEGCDLGDGINGAPNDGSQSPDALCSWSCQMHWCGDGHTDVDQGEECDNGGHNGRTGDTSANIGACSSFCKIPDIPSNNNPPVALCAARSVQVTNTCGMTADINNGSNDPDGDLAGCVQSPAGPYSIGETMVTLTCTDDAGNQASCEAKVTVTDKVLPTVALSGSPNQTLECVKGGTYTDDGATASDLCEGPLPQSAITKSGTVNMGVPSLYTLSYYATDSSGNQSATVQRKVTVSDTLKPVITRNGMDTTIECRDAYTDQGATAADQCDGPLNVVTTGSVNSAAVGDYVLRYNVKDGAGHPADEMTRTIFVRDRLKPTVTPIAPTTLTAECGGTFTDLGATADDLCAGALVASVLNSNLDLKVPGSYSITYKATDPSGNVGTSSARSVTVSDTLVPTLTLLGEPSMGLECATAFTDPGASASDQCYGNLTSAISKTGTVNNKQLGTPQTITYNVKDPKNNAATPVTRTVTVSDTQGPTVTVNGPLSQNVECGGAYADPGASANDACAGALTVTVNSPANPNAPGNYDVTYSATDPSGNTTTSASHRTVTVSDTLAPTLTLLGASPSTLECGGTYTDPGATASDQCAGNITANITKTGSVNAQLPGPYGLHYTVSDGNGHSVSADRTVTVKDTLAPTVTLTGQTTVSVECGGAYNDPGATASDACAGTLAAVPTSTPNANIPNTYNVYYTATDPSGNVGTSATSRTVTVADTLPPTITLNGPANLPQECGVEFNDPGATANDQCVGNLPVTKAGGVNVQVPAAYPLTYSANDGSHTVTTERTVTVSDTQAPTIAISGDLNVTYECGSPYVDQGATANDTCDGNLTNRIVATQTGNQAEPGVFTISYSVTDNAGHQTVSPTQRTVHVNDNAPPTLVLNGSATVALECADPYNDLGAKANDACFGDVSSRITKTGTVNNNQPGSYQVTYNVSDPAGQAAPAVSRTVNVSDTKKPVVTIKGSATATVECGGSYADEGATANDACAGALTAVANTVIDPTAPGNYTVTYSATDPSGNTGVSATGRTVTVADTLPPTIALNGQATMGLECASEFADPGATANDQCSGALPVTKSGSVDQMTPGAYPLHYSATDGANHTISVDRTVNVSDTLPPAITLNGNVNDTFECGTSYVDPGAVGFDACAGTVPVTSTSVGNPNQPGQIIYTYTAKDPSGNSYTSPITRTVTVNDNAPPVLALIGSGTQSQECGSPYTDPGATANDACFGDLTAQITKTGTVNTAQPASYQITYNVTDPSGQSAPAVHRTVNVSDSLAPTINVLGPLSQSVQCGSGPFADPGATANDQCAGDLTAQIVKSGSVNSGAAGNYSITYSVTDPAGHTVTSADTRTVTVVDNLPPTLTLLGNANSGLECGSEFNDPGATANDACAGDLTGQITKSGSVDPKVPATYTVHYSVTDGSNPAVTADRTVTVSDTLPPTLSLNGSPTQSVECGGEYTDPGATATDVCAGNLDAKVQVAGAVNTHQVGNYNVSYTVSDTAGHTAGPVNRAVSVADTLPPTILVNGPTEQAYECGAAYVDPGATANDQCAGDLTSQIVANQVGNPNQPGVFTITYSVTDPAGHSVTSPVVRTVHVNDNAAPTLALNGPALQNLECGSPYVDPGATANDACTGNLTGSIVRSGTVNSNQPNNYVLSYNVTDVAGNSAPTVTRTVHVEDTLNPTITVQGPLNATYECGTEYNDPGATANDACSGDLTSSIVKTTAPVPNQPANFTITYSVTDNAGHTTVSSTQRTVTMNDNLPPSIVLNGPAQQTLECSAGDYVDPGATATDACVGNVPVTVAGSVNMHVNGNYQLRYTAQDTVGNTSPTVTRNVQIIDSVGPAITLNGEAAVKVECKAEYVDQGATAVDVCSPTTTITSTSNVNTAVPNAYLVTYFAKDESGNTTQAVRNVLVEDTTAPVLALKGANPMAAECGVPYVDPGATATDSCQAAAPQVFLDFNGVDITKVDTYTVRYRALDNYGNQSFLERTVNVNDTRGPVISLVGPEYVEIECGTQPPLDATATDLCEGLVPPDRITRTPATLPNVSDPDGADFTVTYTAVDSRGNVSTGNVSRTYHVVDNTPPVLTVNGDMDLFYECTGHAIGNVWQNPGATATDSCQGNVQVHQYNTGDDDGDGIPGDIDPDDFGPGPTTEVEGLYYVQYLAWDDSYKISAAILSVYVQDTLKPVLSLNGPENVQTQCFSPTDDPTDADTEVDIDPDPYVEQGATGDDQCYGDVSPSVIVSGQINKTLPGVYTLRYDVRDGAYNWADYVTRSVEVIDNLSPKLKASPPIKVFPADNGMRTVQLSECSLAWDRCDGYMDIMTKAYDLQVTSNDPANDANDIVVVNNATFQVRAKRTSTNTQRVYTATFKVDDSSVNTTTGTCKVYVPTTTNEPPPTLLAAPPETLAGR